MAVGIAAVGLRCGRVAWSTGSVLSGLAAAALVGIAAFLALGTGIRSGPCPRCRKLNAELRRGTYRDCPGCGEYLTGDGHDLWIADPASVADNPTFGALLPARFVWPDGCVLCQSQVERNISVSITISETGKNVGAFVAGLAIGKVVVRGGEKVYTLDVPHCSKHNDGAALENPALGGPRILFRSYAYSRAFRERNNTPVR
jgi:hypothetical protein